jgi:hypothetical protein
MDRFSQIELDSTASSVPPVPHRLTTSRLRSQASAERTISGATPLTHQPLGFHHQFGRERRCDTVRPEPLLSNRARQQRLFCAALSHTGSPPLDSDCRFPQPGASPAKRGPRHPLCSHNRQQRVRCGGLRLGTLLPHQRRRLAGASVLRIDADTAMLKRAPRRARRSRSRHETQLPDGTCGTSRSASITSASAAGHHRRLRSKDWRHTPRSLGLPHARQPVCCMQVLWSRIRPDWLSAARTTSRPQGWLQVALPARMRAGRPWRRFSRQDSYR